MPRWGIGEQVHQTIGGMMRNPKTEFEANMGHELVVSPEYPATTWLVKLAAQQYNKFHKFRDGTTPYYRITGRPANDLVCLFGEKALARQPAPGRKKHKYCELGAGLLGW